MSRIYSYRQKENLPYQPTHYKEYPHYNTSLYICKKIEEKLKEKFSEVEFIVIPTSGICSFYGEEGGMLLGYEI